MAGHVMGWQTGWSARIKVPVKKYEIFKCQENISHSGIQRHLQNKNRRMVGSFRMMTTIYGLVFLRRGFLLSMNDWTRFSDLRAVAQNHFDSNLSTTLGDISL